jgi:hypothetical protein
MPIPTRRLAPFAALLFAYNMQSTSALAAPSEALDTVDIAIGAFEVRPDINLGVNTQYGPADSGDVTAHSTTIPRAHADFLLGNSQGFALDYYGFYNTYSDSLNRSFAADGNNINVNGSASARVDLDVANAAYKWWIGSGSDVFGIGIGAAYYHVRLGVDASAATNVNNASGTSSGNYSAQTVAPLVEVGWRHAFSHNVRMYVDTSGVEKSGGNLHGHIYNAAFGAEWYFLKNVGVGAEYSATRVRIEDDGGNANLNLRLNGPTVFVKARF